MSFTIFLVQFIFIGCPLASILYFIVSLIRFIGGHRLSKRFPELEHESGMRILRRHLIISSTIMGVFIAIFVGFTVLLSMAIAYM